MRDAPGPSEREMSGIEMRWADGVYLGIEYCFMEREVIGWFLLCIDQLRGF